MISASWRALKNDLPNISDRKTAFDIDLTPHANGVERHYQFASRLTAKQNNPICVQHLPVTQTILKWVGTGRRVLDLGCHWGDITAMIRSQKNDVIGVDLPASAALARQAHGLNVLDHDLNKPIPLSDSEVDVIVASSVLDDIPDDLSFLKECRRILRPGGTIIVNVPNEVSWYRRIQSLLGYESRDYGTPTGYHTLHRYTLKGIKALLTSSGFRVVRQAKCPKRYSKIPCRYWIEKILPITFATDLIVEAEKPQPDGIKLL